MFLLVADDGKSAKRQRSVTGAEKSMEVLVISMIRHLTLCIFCVQEGDKPHGEWKGNGVAKSGSQVSSWLATDFLLNWFFMGNIEKKLFGLKTGKFDFLKKFDWKI